MFQMRRSSTCQGLALGRSFGAKEKGRQLPRLELVSKGFRGLEAGGRGRQGVRLLLGGVLFQAMEGF